MDFTISSVTVAQMSFFEPSSRGVVAFFKPKGMTSHDLVNRVRFVTGVKKVGHAGTLDPQAQGVMILGIGKQGTKQLSKLTLKDKVYQALITLGKTSSTDDSEGDLTQVSEYQPTKEEIEQAVRMFVGDIWQTPPIYSSVKVRGKTAHSLARQGKQPKLEPRQRHVYSITITDYQYPFLKLDIHTGPGVYIRSLARDLGERLTTGAYLQGLIRSRVGKNDLSSCHLIAMETLPVRIFTLAYIFNQEKILLGLKKRGWGAGYYNGFGGKPDKDELIMQTAVREIQEETTLVPESIKTAGLLDISYFNNYHAKVYLFRVDDSSGEPEETEEMKPTWFALNQIPYNQMWPDTRLWLPKL